jgi:GT2 family glycosyltransferase
MRCLSLDFRTKQAQRGGAARSPSAPERTMAKRKGPVAALFGKGGAKRRFAGWVRVDADHVVRGWASDPEDLEARAEVEVRVDGEAIARARADRLDARLVGAQPGDGRYAFAVLIPARLRDGKAHAFQAVVPETASVLMSKAETFTVAAGAAEPTLAVTAVGPAGASGVLKGGQYPADVELELWSGGARVENTATAWTRRGPETVFRVDWPAEAALDDAAVVAGPGMIEAGLPGAPLYSGVRLRARPAGPGRIEAFVQGPFETPEGAVVRLRDGRDGAVLAEAPLQSGRATLQAPVASGGLWAELVVDGRAAPGLGGAVDLAAGGLLRNPGFQGWRDGLPASWSSGVAPDAISRSAYAFPPGFEGLSGDTVRLEVPAGAPAVLLSQPLGAWPAGSNATLALAARASKAVRLEVRVLGSDGTAVQTLPVELVEDWSWTTAEAPLALSGPSGERVELVLASPADEAVVVEVAGLRAGGDGFTDDAADPDAWGLPDNLVTNGRLLDWPRGLIVEAGPGRAETAAGWFVQNRAGTAPVRALAAPTADGEACSLTLTTEAVGDYCRLEARLAPDLVKAGSRLHLTFEAGLPRHAPKAFQSVRPFVVVDRIFLLRYVRRGASVVPEVVANVARKVLLERDARRFGFAFDIDPQSLGDGADLYLAFDFKRDFAVTLQDVRLAPAQEAPAAAGLSLEDPAITAQAKTLKGLESWLSTEIVRPGRRFAPEAERGAPAIRRWSWAPTAQGSVEVVVTVHDAPDETIACLTALVGASGVPHTVRIVDDASGADTRGRIEAFIADKPWMRLVSTPGNIGYTAAANLGVGASDADWVVLLNSDAVVTPGWLEGLLEAAGSDPNVGLVGPLSNAGSYQSVPELKSKGGTWKVNDLPAGWTAAQMGEFIRERSQKAFPRTPLLNGFCTMIRRIAFEQLGGFNEAAFPQGYGEENDLSVRAAAAGWALVVADHVYVFHSKSASFGAARRLHLQKVAGQALAELHPNIDFTELGDRFREIPALVRIRDEVRELFRTAG